MPVSNGFGGKVPEARPDGRQACIWCNGADLIDEGQGVAQGDLLGRDAAIETQQFDPGGARGGKACGIGRVDRSG